MTRTAEVNQTIAGVWRIESAKIIARVARLVGDVGQAEDLAQDALVAALEQWPKSGVPDNPGAWLMATAKRRGIDALRRRSTRDRKEADVVFEMEELRGSSAEELDERLDDTVGDDLLRLIFTACHPVLSEEARVALTLRLLGGLRTEEIARAFLVPVPTVAQRIVRAKRTLADARVPFEMPAPSDLQERLGTVLSVIYLIFNEGYTATAGETWARPQLCEEALRLGRILAELMPHESEVHGLVALMELQASRLRARVGPDGRAVRLNEQDRSRWDGVLVQRGLAALKRAEEAGGGLGPYTLQAAIAACHARARTPEETDWRRIAALYGALAQISPSPIVELNRVVAVGMAFGPEVGLEALEGLMDDPTLAQYHLLPAVHADLLLRTGRKAEARAEFERAAELTRNEAERELLMRRAAECE